MANARHQQHSGHEHEHASGCGHHAVQHGDHTDYQHDGHLHTQHEGHGDECAAANRPEGAGQQQRSRQER